MSHLPDRWSAVLFDLDGTLADTIPLILRSYRHTMREHKGRELPDALWVERIGRPLRDSMADFADSPEESERMQETYYAFQRRMHDDMVRPYPGAVEAVARLAEAGVPLAVVTSKAGEMAGRTLDRCGLAERFAVVVTADDVERGKPDPEPVLVALEALGVEPSERVLFVGDSPHDLKAGRDAGVSVAAASWGPFEPDVLRGERPDVWLDGLDELGAGADGR